MAYTHSKYEVWGLATDGTKVISATNGTGTVARWAPSFVPHVVRAAVLKVQGSTTLSNALTVSIRTQAVGASPTGGTVIDTITLPTTGSLDSKIYYVDNLNTTVTPGNDVAAYITSTGATGAANFEVGLYVEPKWEVPGNNTSMVESA